MYLTHSILDGLKILGFDKQTVKTVAREKSLEEIFLSTLFVNYVIVLVFYIATLISGGISVNGRELNMPVIWGLLMIYPFFFNVVVYGVYGFFGLMAELVDKRKHTKPLISVGFHTAIVYTILVYLIGIISIFDLIWGMFLLSVFLLWFIYTMFLAIHTIYDFSLSQTLIVLMVPFLLGGIAILLANVFFPGIGLTIVELFFN